MRGNWTSMAFNKGTPCTWQTHRHVMGEGWLGSPWSEMKALVRNFVYNPEKKHGLFRFSIRVKRWINCFTNVPHFILIYCFHRSANACRLHCMLMKRQVSRFHDALPSAQVEAPRKYLFCAKYTNLIQFRKLDCFQASTIDSKDPSSFTSVEHSPAKTSKASLEDLISPDG